MEVAVQALIVGNFLTPAISLKEEVERSGAAARTAAAVLIAEAAETEEAG